MKIAVIGAGLMGEWHCHFARLAGAQIGGVADTEQSRSEALANRFDAKAYTDVNLMLSEQAPLVVHICTPTGSHDQLVRKCLDANCHVLVEKPLAISSFETEQLVFLSAGQGLLLNPVHQFAFQIGFQELLTRQENLGQPVKVSFLTCTAGGEAKSTSERRKILTEILPHPISLFSRLFPKMDLKKLRLLQFTDQYLELRTDEAAASITISLAGRPTRNELIYIGTNGTAHVDLFHGFALFEGAKVSRSEKLLKPFKFGAGVLYKAGTNLAARAAKSEPAYPGLRELIARFYAAVESGSAAPISDKEILNVASVVDLVEGTAKKV